MLVYGASNICCRLVRLFGGRQYILVVVVVVMQGLFIVRIFKSYNNIMLTPPSKVVLIVTVAYLTTFFALASGLINALIEGRGINRFMIPSRSAQTIGETVVFILILFMGMVGTIMLYQSGRSSKPKGTKGTADIRIWRPGDCPSLGFHTCWSQTVIELHLYTNILPASIDSCCNVFSSRSLSCNSTLSFTALLRWRSLRLAGDWTHPLSFL